MREPHPFVFKAHSAFHQGEELVELRLRLRLWLFLPSPLARRAWDFLLERNTFVGLRWSEEREQNRRIPRTESQRVIKAGLEKWGRNWRGNWAPQRARLEIPFTQEVSAHERFEAVLLLREWMQDKFTPAEQKELLAHIMA